MWKKKKMPIDFNPAHPDQKLITRRDFLSAGVIGFSGTAMLPSLMQSVLMNQAEASGTSPIPFIIFDCAGGASLPGNWMPVDSGGNPLASYSTLGLGNSSQYVVDTSFGAPMAAPTAPVPPSKTTSSTQFSQIYQSLVTQLLPGILGAQAPGQNPQYPNSLLQMGIIPANSMSDSQTNTFSPISLISAAGVTGSMVPVGMGTSAAQSGGNSDWGSGNPAYKPLQIQSVTALTDALSYGTTLYNLGPTTLGTIASALMSLSTSQATKFQAMNLGTQFNQLMQTAFGKNINYTNLPGGTPPGINPTQDANASSVYPISQNGVVGSVTTGTAGAPVTIGAANNPSLSDPNVVMATLVLNAILGNSGPVVITVGGCDYHGQGQTVGDTKDSQIGNCIAWAMNLAYLYGKKVAFAVYTDGGIYTQNADRNWTGDDNGHGLAVFGVMDPAGKPTLAQSQVGAYTTAQTCDPNFIVGNDPLKVCHTLFLNYLAVTGQVGNYSSIIQAQDPRNSMLLSGLYPSFTALTSNLLLFPNATG